MNGLHAAFDELVADVPEYGDLDVAIEHADRDRRRRRGILAGIAAAAAVLVVLVGILVVGRGEDAAPPPIAPTPTPTPTPRFESPTAKDRPAALLDAAGALVMATMDQEQRAGSATLWRRESGRWQRLGTLQHAVPMHWTSDSEVTSLSLGPGPQDVIATGLAGRRTGFSDDGGATWSYLAAPPGCGDCWIGAHRDHMYVVSDSPTTLVRAAFGAAAWEEVPLPPTPDRATGYRGPLVLDDGSLVLQEISLQDGSCSADSRYRVSRDHGDTWSGRRSLPGTGTCIAGPRGNTLYASDDAGAQLRSTDLIHWEPIQVDGWYPPLGRDLPAACSRRDPGYVWLSELPLEVGDEVYRLFHVVSRDRWNRVTHVLKVSRDGCRTWQRVPR